METNMDINIIKVENGFTINVSSENGAFSPYKTFIATTSSEVILFVAEILDSPEKEGDHDLDCPF